MLKVSTPRLLPATIAAMGTLLLLKGGVLLQSVVTHGETSASGMVGAAYAASSEQTKDLSKEAGQDAGKDAAKPKAAAAGAPSSPPIAPEGPPPVSETEKALLQDLRQRRLDLDKRAATVSARESAMIATEQKLAERVAELQALQRKLEGLDAAQKQKEDAGWQGLVRLYETMKPKDAATIFNDMSMPVLLQILDRMKDAKAASVMAAMSPERARDVTGELAQMRTGRDAMGAPVAGLKSNSPGG
jgi:flagellar motility protein MotE (MotC chaperone)